MWSKENQLTTISNFTDKLVKYLKDAAPTNTGALSKSIDGQYTEKGLDISALDYFKFVENGVNGTEKSWGSPYSFTNKMIPISSIKGYADSRGINPYALQKSIFKSGIKPHNMITTKLNPMLDTFATDVAESIWDDFENNEKQKDKTLK